MSGRATKHNAIDSGVAVLRCVSPRPFALVSSCCTAPALISDLFEMTVRQSMYSISCMCRRRLWRFLKSECSIDDMDQRHVPVPEYSRPGHAGKASRGPHVHSMVYHTECPIERAVAAAAHNNISLLLVWCFKVWRMNLSDRLPACSHLF